jgi:uncharacterized protein YbjT (DUF2867 family)
MITVMGATGQVGGEVVRRLRKEGQAVRALGRSDAKLADLRATGAETLAGDAADAAFLARAFKGASAVFTLQPPDLQAADYRALQDRHGEAIVAAVRESGVTAVVQLSSIGADQASGTGPIAGVHAQEERLKTLRGVDVLALRPGFFLENFYAAIPVIKHQGVLADAVAPDTVLPMIATRDVAAAAAAALVKRDFKGFVVRELLGQRDLTHAEVARVIGAAIGKPDLAYVQVPYEDMVGTLVGAGLSRDVATVYVEMSRAFNEGRVRSLEGRSAANTTPTSIEEFARGFAAACAVA